MENEINTRQYGISYDYYSYETDRITDANVLYESWLKAKANSDWKPKVQIFEMHWLWHIAEVQRAIRERTYRLDKPSEFIIYERGKRRLIHGNQVADRMVEHALNDEIIIPSIRPYLIYDNGASLEGKGVDFTRRRLVRHLTSFYREYGNDGYVLLFDFSKYYDNICHSKVLELFHKYVTDETALWLLDVIIEQFKVDVSYMTDEEYAACMDVPFNSLEYQNIDKRRLTGEKYMNKHLDIGNQTSQSAGVLYPTPLDNYIKIVCGEKYYDRYMDDGIIIHHSKKHLIELSKSIGVKAQECGLFINERKTRIVRLSDCWRFLQIQYSLTDTGRIIRKINPKRVTTERRKMKYLAPRKTETEFYNEVHSWVRSNRKYMSNQQYKNIVALYNQLRKETIGYVQDNTGRRDYVKL